MAELNEVWDDNVQGQWYVDKNCILCSLCSDLAPNNFKESDEGDHDIVFKQPEGEAELDACNDALEQCPVESIGNNRES